MKAIRYHDYGPSDVLRLEEAEKPVPADDEVLIKVRAASVNPYDWHFMRGEPYLLRLATGIRRPKSPCIGADVAGEVEATGKDVTGVKPGDAVFGVCKGSFAEYACGSALRLAVKPENVTFEQAASLPIAAITALQSLRDHGHIQPGHKVLVNGAAGGVGSFAVQIARSFGAEVTGVCSTKNLEQVRSIGADHVIDYTRQDFANSEQRYDILLDLVGNHSLSSCGRVLTPTGKYLGAGGTTDPWMLQVLVQMVAGSALSWFGGKKFRTVLARVNTRDLSVIGELVKSGTVMPVIDRCYRLSEVPEAVRYLEQGHARGKVVMTVN